MNISSSEGAVTIKHSIEKLSKDEAQNTLNV